MYTSQRSCDCPQGKNLQFENFEKFEFEKLLILK